MSINIGSNSFGLYLGSSKIAEAYVGSTKVYSSGQAGLPAKTIRFKFNDENYIPTTDTSISGTSTAGTWTRVSSSPNIWDWYYDSTSWAGVSYTEGLFRLSASCSIIDANLLGVTNINFMFAPTSYNGTDYRCSGLYSIDKFNNTNSVASMSNTFRGCSSLNTIPLFNTSNVTSMTSMFFDCLGLSSIPLLDTSNVTNMNYMFCGCSSLLSVPLLNTSNVTSMNYMFHGCSSLNTIPLFNTSNVTSMMSTFFGCRALSSIPLLDTSNVTNMNYMFRGCNSLLSVPLLDTSNVTSMYRMFYNCVVINNLPLFDTSNVTDMEDMFGNCIYLQSIPLFNTSSVTDMDYMFYNCLRVQSGALALYQQASTQATPPSSHNETFKKCGANTLTGAAELAQIPSSWGGTGT